MCIPFFKKYSFFRFLLPKELHIYLIKIKTYFIALNSEHFTANQLKLTWYVQCLSASALLFSLDYILNWSQCLVLEGYSPDSVVHGTAQVSKVIMKGASDQLPIKESM